ncbi:MAG: hypothetical protein E7442_03780 [Ruminococcaceae bacterium]|nr:hypothetical protein [Oscillospiraceae bacterium]
MSIRDDLAYAAFCAKALKSFHELKNDYMALSPESKERLKKDAGKLLKESGIAELLGFDL